MANKDEAMRLALTILLEYHEKENGLWGRTEDAIEALRTALAQPDEQLGITYEEANTSQTYCQRCGKKLGTEVTDIHTCTPKENKPVAWMIECADFWEHYTYINEIAQERYSEEAKMWLKKLHAAPPKKGWVGLTDEEL